LGLQCYYYYYDYYHHYAGGATNSGLTQKKPTYVCIGFSTLDWNNVTQYERMGFTPVLDQYSRLKVTNSKYQQDSNQWVVVVVIMMRVKKGLVVLINQQPLTLSNPLVSFCDVCDSVIIIIIRLFG